MARTKIRQSEQIYSSKQYDDQLNQAAAETSFENNIGSNNSIVSVTTNTVVVGSDLVSAGANSGDDLVISGSDNNDGTYEISSLSYSSPNTTIAIVGSLTTGGNLGSAQVKVDRNKNLQTDLNHIRTQLKKLNQATNWYDNPTALPIDLFNIQTSSPIPSGTAIDTGADFDAGAPYDLNVFLNGDLLQPSTISGGVIVDAYDYQELTAGEALAEIGDVGRKIEINFDINSGDIIQFTWSK